MTCAQVRRGARENTSWPAVARAGSNRRPSAFQAESWLTRLCFNWSEWARGCQPDALEHLHLVHRFGPILAPRIGSVLFWPGFMATKPVTEAIGIATAPSEFAGFWRADEVGRRDGL